MLNDQPGKSFPPDAESRRTRRSSFRWNTSRIVIVDPILASRVELAQAISQPGFFVESASSAQQTVRLLNEHEVSLVIVDHDLDQRQGLEFLTELRRSHPQTRRALVTDLQDLEAIRPLLDIADLCFIVRKPWDPATLRETVCAGLDANRNIAAWRELPVSNVTGELSQFDPTGPSDRISSERPGGELLVRGLLAGLNACENETSLFRFVHDELTVAFGPVQTFWLSEKTPRVVSFRADERIASESDLEGLEPQIRRALTAAKLVSGGARLGASTDERSALIRDRAIIGFSVHESGERMLTMAMAIPTAGADESLAVLGALHSGLGMALRRIHQTTERAEAAQRLARRVSNELRSPVGALTSAIAGLRSEAEKAGMPADWFDRLTSESERVIRAVRTVEHEMSVESQEGPTGSF